MWKSLVQPHVDYCSQLYFPHLSSETKLYEENPRSDIAQLLGTNQSSEVILSRAKDGKVQNTLCVENIERILS